MFDSFKDMLIWGSWKWARGVESVGKEIVVCERVLGVGKGITLYSQIR